MLVGEQPGNQEDLSGHPFVGPAGKMLDKTLLDAGIARQSMYITNVVKDLFLPSMASGEFTKGLMLRKSPPAGSMLNRDHSSRCHCLSGRERRTGSDQPRLPRCSTPWRA
jgi:uracil-DNA glycosylase